MGWALKQGGGEREGVGVAGGCGSQCMLASHIHTGHENFEEHPTWACHTRIQRQRAFVVATGSFGWEVGLTEVWLAFTVIIGVGCIHNLLKGRCQQCDCKEMSGNVDHDPAKKKRAEG